MKQPTSKPTRKMWAVIIAGVATSIIKPLADAYAPGVLTPEMVSDLGVWVQAAVMAGAGYLTTEKASGETK